MSEPDHGVRQSPLLHFAPLDVVHVLRLRASINGVDLPEGLVLLVPQTSSQHEQGVQRLTEYHLSRFQVRVELEHRPHEPVLENRVLSAVMPSDHMQHATQMEADGQRASGFEHRLVRRALSVDNVPSNVLFVSTPLFGHRLQIQLREHVVGSADDGHLPTERVVAG